MPQNETKGFVIADTYAYIRDRLPEEKDAILAGIRPETLAVLENPKKDDWYPRSVLAEVINAMVSPLEDPKARVERMEDAGRHAAEQATNTFLRLLFKVLSPKLFCRKFPDFFDKYHRGGR
ncbi:MAG: hypothetical protein AAF658_07620, partial [Myxococcota bacterium]